MISTDFILVADPAYDYKHDGCCHLDTSMETEPRVLVLLGGDDSLVPPNVVYGMFSATLVLVAYQIRQYGRQAADFVLSISIWDPAFRLMHTDMKSFIAFLKKQKLLSFSIRGMLLVVCKGADYERYHFPDRKRC